MKIISPKKILLLGLIFVACLTFKFKQFPQITSPQDIQKTSILFPLPKSFQFGNESTALQISPCEINYKIVATPATNLQKIINHYLIEVFKCSQLKPGNVTLAIVVKDTNQMIAENVNQEKYLLTIRQNNNWDLITDTHVGFVRGFETFSQLFESNDNPKGYVIKGRPIIINDSPNYVWRGVMLDTSRHYFPVDSILHLIDGLMYNKMSILHWHMTDEDSFPIEIPTRPELSNQGSIGGKYTQQNLLTIINYAKIRGVRVIPQFDTPAHTQSWGRSDLLKDIIVKCNDFYEGQFDPTLNETYKVVQDVMQYVNLTFPDKYAHFGGDQIEEQCWMKKHSIYEWMQANQIKTYRQLQIYYRKQEKKLWREKISQSKKAIYWANEQIDLPLDEDDVIQWWGDSKNVAALENRKNQVILSNYDITYLDLGFGGRNGNGYGTYITWRQLYAFQPRIKNVNVIGGETCMWSEICDKNTLDQKIWIRSSALAERLWNVGVDIKTSLLNISERLIAQSKRMKNRGFKVSPVTVGLCEKDPSICFK